MILINEKTGHCELKGTGIDLLSDLSVIVHILVTDTGFTEPDIMRAVVIGLENIEEEED